MTPDCWAMLVYFVLFSAHFSDLYISYENSRLNQF